MHKRDARAGERAEFVADALQSADGAVGERLHVSVEAVDSLDASGAAVNGLAGAAEEIGVGVAVAKGLAGGGGVVHVGLYRGVELAVAVVDEVGAVVAKVEGEGGQFLAQGVGLVEHFLLVGSLRDGARNHFGFNSADQTVGFRDVEVTEGLAAAREALAEVGVVQGVFDGTEEGVDAVLGVFAASGAAREEGARGGDDVVGEFLEEVT